MEDASYGLAHDLAILDREEPGWDYELQIKGALRRLRSDSSEANQRDVELLFGKTMAQDALRRVIAEGVAVVADTGPTYTAFDPTTLRPDLRCWGWLAAGQTVTVVISERRRPKRPQHLFRYTGLVDRVEVVAGKTYVALTDVNLSRVVGPLSRVNEIGTNLGKISEFRVPLNSPLLTTIVSEDELSLRRRQKDAALRAKVKTLKGRKVVNAFCHRRKQPFD